MNSLLKAIPMIALLGMSSRAQVGSIPEAPKTAAAYIDEGARDLLARRNALAADAYRHALELEPDSAAAYVGLGSAYYRMGRLPDSIAAFDSALRIEPDRATARLNRAISLGALGQTADALRDLTDARRLAANDARVLNEIAITLENQFTRTDDAIAVYKEALRADPRSAVVLHNLGLLYVKLSRYGDAIEPFERALDIDPAFRNARFFLAESHSQLRQYDASVDSWSKFLALVPDGPDATVNRAWDFLCWGGHGRSAAADARRFLEINGWKEERSPYMALVAWLGDREEGLDEAARLALDEAAVRLPGAWPYPVVKYLRGEITEQALLDAATSNDWQTEAHAYIGVSLLFRGEKEQARTHLTWVASNGNRRYREYVLASRALERF